MNPKHCLSLFAALAAPALFAATPVIRADSVTFSQNATTRFVTIGYTLEDADAVVTVDVLTNGVSIGAENFVNIDGDVNRRVAPGGHLIVWNPRASWPDHVFTNNEVSVEVRAWDVTVPPDYMVVDLSFENAPVRYYVSTNALPAGGLTNNIYRSSKLVMRRIPASGNVWTMGSPSSEPDRVAGREIQHLVTMTNDYYLGVFPVTDAQHQLVVNSQTSESYLVCEVSYNQVRGTSVNWPTTGHEVASNSYLKKWRDLTGIDFDLPTSAQWEFACRAGTGTRFYFGDDTSLLADHAWYTVNAGNARHKVGEKLPNQFGLYDLYGNVWDWCLDWTGGISADSVVEPTGPADGSVDTGKPNCRVNRGGNYLQAVGGCRSAKVNPKEPTAAAGIGYRLLCPPTLKW